MRNTRGDACRGGLRRGAVRSSPPVPESTKWRVRALITRELPLHRLTLSWTRRRLLPSLVQSHAPLDSPSPPSRRRRSGRPLAGSAPRAGGAPSAARVATRITRSCSASAPPPTRLRFIGAYLGVVADEATARGYSFDATRIVESGGPFRASPRRRDNSSTNGSISVASSGAGRWRGTAAGSRT